MLAFLLLVALCQFLAVYSFNPDLYKCSICVSSAEKMTDYHGSLFAGCSSAFDKDSCSMFFTESTLPSLTASQSPSSPREYCQMVGFCSAEQERWQKVSATSLADYDVRVTRAMGQRGYDKVRVSVIANQTLSSPTFSYSSQFKYRWTQFYLNSGIVSVTPGVKTSVNIAPGTDIQVLLPVQGAGTRGIIMADPCFQSQWVNCLYQNKFDAFNRLTSLLDAAMTTHDDVSYYQILGDNFYDQNGIATASWFNALSPQAKSKFLQVVPGNHDLWVNGAPSLWTSKDQQGNGFMQFYAQDTYAALHPPATAPAQPFDFSLDPDNAAIKGRYNLAAANNFFFNHLVGNVGMIGFSNAHSSASTQQAFDDACAWAADNADHMDILLILGHYNSPGDGCDSSSTTPLVFEDLKTHPTCSKVASKIRYFMGHKHCNMVTEADYGFMIGGLGMMDMDACGGVFGFNVVDTTDGRFKVWYFPVQENNSASTIDQYNALLTCFSQNGVSGCYHLATLWADTPLK